MPWDVQRLASEGQVCLAERFALSGMGVDQARHVTRRTHPSW